MDILEEAGQLLDSKKSESQRIFGEESEQNYDYIRDPRYQRLLCRYYRACLAGEWKLGYDLLTMLHLVKDDFIQREKEPTT
jgi:hypothetical protein